MPSPDKVFERISPFLIKLTSSSINLSLSKRFVLFDAANKLSRRIEEDPYLNFIALLKNYKVLGRFLHGHVHDFYRDRNKMYFKNFFGDRKLYALVKKDLEELHPEHGGVKVMITKKGVLVYDNYKRNEFNTLLLTVHSGTWVPDFVEKKLNVSEQTRHSDEDIGTHKIYRDLVLKKGGIWVDNKRSRFVIDFNRNPDKAIYYDNSEYWLSEVWKEKLTQAEVKNLYDSYYEFYFTLSELVNAYRFNIIFDGHSMNPKDGRPAVSFGTNFIPTFYMPIVYALQGQMRKLGYSTVKLNTPYGGGYILQYLKKRFPDVFIFSMELNKDLYMNKPRSKVIESKQKKISKDLVQLFDLDVSDHGIYKPGA